MIGGSNRMLSAEQTAKFLGVHTTTLYRNWRYWGLKAYRVGNALKFRERDVENWLDMNEAA